jgi:hypothetical protein
MYWQNIGLDLTLTGKDSKGERYLKQFLKDYTALTNEVVNAQCVKCLTRYFNTYINLTTMSESKSQYKLHKKREGLPLAFGSSIFVTNNNITDEYAEALITKYKDITPDFEPSYLFEKFPVKEIKIETETVATKPRKRRTKTKSND